MIKGSVDTLDISQFFFRIILLSIIDISKILFGQDIARSLMNIIYYFFFLLTISFKSEFTSNNMMKKIDIYSNFLFFIIILIDVSELISWIFIGSAINTQALSTFNVKIIIDEYPGIPPLLFIVLLIIIFSVFLPFYKKYVYISKLSLLINMIHLSILFIFALSIIHDFKDKNNNSLFEAFDPRYIEILKMMLYNKFNENPKVISTHGQLKNLIFLMIESFPNEFVQNSKIAPNLNNFSKIFEYIGPIQPQPYTTWTLSGTSVTETGLPQIYPDTEFRSLSTKTDFQYIIGIKGIPDILYSHNYTINYIVTGSDNIMGFNRWIDSHHFNRIYKGKNDLYTYNHLIEKIFPEIDKSARGPPNNRKLTMHLILNSQTHFPYGRPRWCKMNFPPELEESQKCFHCIDEAVGRVVNKYLSLKMYEHSLLVLFPDHPPFFTKYKENFILFPGIEKVDPNLKIKDQITYYDFSPTILDLMGIKDYRPEFPYGMNIYTKTKNLHDTVCMKNVCIKKHRKPDVDDLSIIYKFYHYEQGKEIKATYNLSDTFKCKINGSSDYYYSDKPCIRDAKSADVVQ